jgi:DMSO/TMAO reductase YedYZ molybdopterin-dependent catalytic subunit
MTEERANRFPQVGSGEGMGLADAFYREEIQLALRNRGMPLEGLRYDVTPVGMHYLLIHFDIPEADADDWRLEVGGLVKKPLTLSPADLRERPRLRQLVTMECGGNGRALMDPRPVSQPWLHEAIGTAEWGGTPLRGLLEEAGLKEEAVEVVFTGADEGVQGEEQQFYQRSLSIDAAIRDEVMIAYEMNGRPLEPQNGYPLRLLVPGWYGMTSVKWLKSIEAVARPFEGYQMSAAYRYTQSADDPGEPVTTIRVRALMIPPGIPDFLTRVRLIGRGQVMLRGRAWAGGLEVRRVEVSTDGAETWQEGRLEAPIGRYAWRAWSFPWKAEPGEYELAVRATDSEGNTQPDAPDWNYQGMGNNGVQRVRVIVE